MTGKDVVREVICLLKGGEKWTQGKFAKDADGREVDTCSESAETFCLLGAGLKVLNGSLYGGGMNTEAFIEYRNLLGETLYPKRAKNGLGYDNNHIAGYNDRKLVTFEDVEIALTRTLARLNRREKAARKAKESE